MTDEFAAVDKDGGILEPFRKYRRMSASWGLLAEYQFPGGRGLIIQQERGPTMRGTFCNDGVWDTDSIGTRLPLVLRSDDGTAEKVLKEIESIMGMIRSEAEYDEEEEAPDGDV